MNLGDYKIEFSSRACELEGRKENNSMDNWERKGRRKERERTV